jgi:AcrR family transcriptional regulator
MPKANVPPPRSPRHATATPAPGRSTAAPAPRQRLAPADRERQIIEGAIAYFSEAGFSGQTRELSKRLGITQPLLYRYFENKQALVERVYQTVFEGRWNPAWIPLLRNRSVPLRERLVEFYRQYALATYRPDWIRIYLHAGLADPTLNRRYIRLVRRELLPVFCRELRHACGLPDEQPPVTEDEIEFVWSLHGGIFYRAMREHVYRTRIDVAFLPHVALAVDTFLAGAAVTYPQLLARVMPAAKPAAKPGARQIAQKAQKAQKALKPGAKPTARQAKRRTGAASA